MFESLSQSERNIAIQRLTALWALNECGLGGVLHAFQSPFTGLLVGSIAMICIAFICALAEHKWKAIMSALVVVLIIKALVSPHSSPTAYIAVSFQAIAGALIYRYIPHLLFASLLFVSLGLIESAIQRLLTLTLLYGNTLWEAINIWGDLVTKKWGIMIPVSSSILIIYIYLFIHLLAGLFIGWFVWKIIGTTDKLWGESRFQLQLELADKKSFIGSGKVKKKWKRYFLFGVLVVLILIAYSIGNHSDFEKGLFSILRAVVLLTFWFVFLAPLLIKLLQRWLGRKHQELSSQVAHTMDMIPQLIWIIDKAWKETAHLTWIRRWKVFLIHSLLYILQYKSVHDPYPNRANT